MGSVRPTDLRRHDRQRVPGVTVPPGVHLVAEPGPNRQIGGPITGVVEPAGETATEYVSAGTE